MRKNLLLKTLLSVATAALANSVSAAEVTGAGSTFVYPIMAKWADAYKAETGTSVNYQSIGSGGGIKQIQNKTVDFGATDMPLKVEELEKNDLAQFPVINGATVIIINVPGVKPGELKLTGKLVADIFLGTIKKWNDQAIASLNKDLKLPDLEIKVVHRSDGSGTTFIFSNYLSKVSPEWKSKVGEGSALSWPTGMGGKGNEGLANYVKQFVGTIGYVEYAYALQTDMTYTQMQNKAGKFVAPSDETFAAVASGVDWSKAPGYYLIMTDASGPKSWPIAGSTFILMQKNPAKPEQAKEALKFFRWAFKNGAKDAQELHYVPLPTTTIKGIEKTWSKEFKGVDIKSL